MKRALLSLVPALLSCLLLAAPGQDDDPDPRKVPDRDLWPWSEIGNEEHQRLLQDLQGAWRLTTLVDPQLPESGRREVGYALVADRWMSIEIHVGVDDPGGRPLGMIRTGTYRIALGPGNLMELSTLIGTYLDRFGEVRAEPTSTRREFEVTVSSNLFTLRRADGYEISFARLEDNKPRRDIFGRPR